MGSRQTELSSVRINWREWLSVQSPPPLMSTTTTTITLQDTSDLCPLHLSVTSTSDCRLRIETTNFRKITPETESVSSTTEEYNFENVKLIKELIIDVIH